MEHEEETLMSGRIIKKIRIKVKDYWLIAKIKIASDYVINTNQSDLLAKECTYGFLKLNNTKKNRLEFSGPKGISLYERLKNPVSKYDFFFLLEQIIDVIQRIEKIGLSRSNLVLDLQYIFFNESTKELNFIYLPIATPHGSLDIRNFVEQIIYSVKPLEKDGDYLSEFSYFIKKLDVFNASTIESYIYKIDEDIVRLVKKTDTSDAIKNSVLESGKNEVYLERAASDEKTDLMDDDEKTEFMYSIDKAEGVQEYSQMREKRIVGIVDDESTCMLEDEVTELLDDEKTDLFVETDVVSSRFPTLLRTQTDEIVRINKPVFRIGKEENCVDYVVADNAAISRSHADIISRGVSYFVFDLRSKNKTYINNRVLPAEHEVEIFDGDILKLANEEFVFRV